MQKIPTIFQRDRDIKRYQDAAVGDDAYTWENEGATWGEYVFETVDPFETGAADCCETVVRKRWRLIEVVEVSAPSDVVRSESRHEDGCRKPIGSCSECMAAYRVTAGTAAPAIRSAESNEEGT